MKEERARVIINTGQRTDIPAFYAPWFANRLREGYVCVRNPYNPRQVSRYLLLQFVISLATGVCVWLALWAIGVEFAPTWGVLAFVLNFIPTIGSIIASIPPILIALVQSAPHSYWQAVVTAIALLAIQMTIGNVISPRVMGDHLNLSPVAVLVSLLFWSWLWGPAGALLSVPITAAIKIVCDNIAPLAPIGVLLGSGRAVRDA